jgi:hypothetical protein
MLRIVQVQALLDALKPDFDTVYAVELIYVVGMHVRQLRFYRRQAHFEILHVLGRAVHPGPYVAQVFQDQVMLFRHATHRSSFIRNGQWKCH